MLDKGGLNEGFPLLERCPSVQILCCVNCEWFDPHTMQNSIDTLKGIHHQISNTGEIYP